MRYRSRPAARIHRLSGSVRGRHVRLRREAGATTMRRRLVLTAAAAAMVVLGTAGPSATADLGQSRVVSANPADHTPHVLDGVVRAFAEVGDKIVVGGT